MGGSDSSNAEIVELIQPQELSIHSYCSTFCASVVGLEQDNEYNRDLYCGSKRHYRKAFHFNYSPHHQPTSCNLTDTLMEVSSGSAVSSSSPNLVLVDKESQQVVKSHSLNCNCCNSNTYTYCHCSKHHNKELFLS